MTVSRYLLFNGIPETFSKKFGNTQKNIHKQVLFKHVDSWRESTIMQTKKLFEGYIKRIRVAY